MNLEIERTVYDAMLAAARDCAPLEACGLCGGKDNRIERFYPLTNADTSGEHYTMLPREQFAAVKAMRAAGQEMLAIWHSHPETPARMSDEDLRLAYTPGVVYLILSLLDPGNPSLRGFLVGDNRIEETEVHIVDSMFSGAGRSRSILQKESS